uniref:Tetratricopeptide repeat protein n=1 Tax=Prevotella sp. GTC17253 TaxID=3236793 RepID=A0AB33IQ54_9BACT
MTDILYLLFFWGILYIIAFVFYPIWRKRRDAGRGLFVKHDGDNKITVTNALKKLNCHFTWMQEQGKEIVKYDFQKGHFRIEIEQGTPYIQLSYLFFYTTKTEYLDLVRALMNQCNLNTETLKIVYSLDEKEHSVNLHMTAGLLINEQTSVEILSRAMTDMFRWQTNYVGRISKMIEESNKAMGLDFERKHAELTREIFLIREQEILHQVAGTEWRQTEEQSITLDHLLTSVLGLVDFVPMSLCVFSERETRTINDTEEIRNFVPASVVIGGNDFLQDEALLSVTLITTGQLVTERTVNIHIQSEKKADESLYFRMTVTLIPLSIAEDVKPGSDSNTPQVVSVLAAYDLSAPKKRLDEFRYMWKEAMEKNKRGDTADLSEEQKLIAKCMEPALALNAYRGRILFSRKRFCEALFFLESVYTVLSRQFDTLEGGTREAFFEVCYLIGFCYGELKQYQRACYYLEMTLTQQRITYTEEYINCLVNGKDFRALHVIDSLLEDVVQTRKVDEGTCSEMETSFISFLYRRKAYVYIDKQRYDEAEKLLRKMLDDPENSDFAISELAYIQKMKTGG